MSQLDSAQGGSSSGSLAEDEAVTTPSIQDLEEAPGLWYKLHVLLYGLRNYQANSRPRDRLKTVIDPSYIGSPYFTPSEATMVKSVQISGSTGSSTEIIENTLNKRLERRMRKRVERGSYSVPRVCCS